MTLGPSASRVPRWAVLVLGVVTVIIGAILVTRPFQSLAILVLLVAAGLVLTGFADLADQTDAPDQRVATALGITWVVLGIAALVWPSLSLATLAIVVALALIVGGAVRLLPAIRGDADQRVAALLLGVASIVLGVVALGWPDITLLVVAVVFGIRLVLYGLALIARVVRPADPTASPSQPGRLSRFARTAGEAVALLVTLLLAVVSLRINQGAPVVDAFYDAPASIPEAPGQLLRSEPFTRALPEGAQAWRILYTTTRANGVPALGSGLVIAPTERPAGPTPVIAWAHGTTGVDQTCAPSLLDDPFEAGALFVLDKVIDEGWAMVATDYIGLGTEAPHPYLVGQPTGRAVLDAIRAAHTMPELELDPRTVVWGHSQGGGAALWTGQLAPDYAPDANVIGVASLAPASDLASLAGNLDDVTGGEIFGAYIIQGYSDTYPDVRFDDYVRPSASVFVREMASRCLAEPEVFVSVATVLLVDGSVWSGDPTAGPLGDRLAENVPRGPIPAPLLLAQGLTDPLVLPDVQAAYARSRCDAGGDVDYRTFEGRDHVGLVAADSPLIPELLAWTQDRLDGRPSTPTC
jgi:uncharacterized membrane protein HdeD (DUF308 family)/acetyl esterase/lipase